MAFRSAFDTSTFSVSPLCLAPSSEFDSLWAETLGEPEICVAILDGAVDVKHPCFSGANLAHLSTSASESHITPSGHGTHIASVVFGQHNGTVRGIAPRCRGLFVPVFESTSEGGVVPCSQQELASAIALAVQHGANVINISGGQLDAEGDADPMLARAVQSCSDNGVLLVAAAGNDGCQCLHVPAALSSVLVVGAMDKSGAPMEFSNWGEEYAAKGILAPGDAVIGAGLDGGITTHSGTSVATPIVTGVAALLMCVQRKRHGRTCAETVRRALLDTAIGCDEKPINDCRRLLAGRLNVAGALSHIIKGAETEMPDQTSQFNSIDSQIAACVPPQAIAEANPPSRLKPVPAATFDPDAVVASEAPNRVAGPANGTTVSASCDATGLAASDCGCGGKTATKPSIAYAIGQIDFDFASESVRDSFVQQGVEVPEDPAQLLEHLAGNPADATSVVWTLVQETTPIYAIQPRGAFAMETYSRLREFMVGQLNHDVGQVSVPGTVIGNVTLCNGQSVPLLAPELRGMYSWTTGALIKAVLAEGDAPADAGQQVINQKKAEELENFLQRIYHELRNTGASPQDRALNFAATNSLQAAKIFENEMMAGRFLQSICVEQSPICRPGAECWDVKLTFFHPAERLTEALHVHRYTIDVSEVIPVTVGDVRSWHAY